MFGSLQRVNIMDVKTRALTHELADGAHADRQDEFLWDAGGERHVVDHRLRELVERGERRVEDEALDEGGSGGGGRGRWGKR